ncbi:MAG TPA: T9SS type A sorting domain-containing protein [Chitinophagaceae bacterium]|jgi:hypothetical protein|nr:T9SS type A sorting domain-containing protein [Chitinophagaceae bacterium]
MKKIYFLLFAVLSSVTIFAQNTANYSFATATSGSLTDMSSGTTQLQAPNTDDTPSPLTNIGFDFFFQGVRYSQFSINENGLIRLGASAQASTPYKPLAQAGIPIITAYGADQRTHTSGKVHYKVNGSAPNRILIVEWLNNQANFDAGGTANLTYQVRLSESTGVIEFVYGSMTMSTLGAASTDSRDPNIGFSSSNTAGTVGSVTAAQSGAPAPTYNGASATPVANLYTAGAITALTSAVDGSRRVFTFTPPTPTVPTSLTFTAIAQVSMTLNWVDAPDELLYAIYRSTDGTNYTFDGTAAANAISYNSAGLIPGTNYFWRVFSVSEGGLSTALTGTQATLPPANIVSTAVGGNWSIPGTWVGGVVPTSGDNATIADGATVTIDVTTAICFNLTVGQGTSGVLQYIATPASTLTVINNVGVAPGGNFNAGSGSLTTHILNIGGSSTASTSTGNLVVDGTFDMNTTAGVITNFFGTADGTVSGTGPIADFFSIVGQKGTNQTAMLDVLRIITTSSPAASGSRLTVNGGTIRISSATIVTPWFGSNTITGINGKLWINNTGASLQCVGTGVSATGGGSPTINGTLEVDAGTFGYGQGNNTLTINGTLIVGGASAVVNQFGAVLFSANSIFTMTAGKINIDPQNVTNIAATTNLLRFTGPNTVNFTGGEITIVDPHAATGTGRAVSISTNTGSGSYNMAGGTISFGNGISSTAGSADGFDMDTFVGTALIALGNVTVDNPVTNAATRFVRANVALTPLQVFILGDLTITNTGGSRFNLNGHLVAFGKNIINNGTFDGTVANSRLYWLGNAVASTYSGTGVNVAPLVSFDVDNALGVTIDPAVSNIVTSRIILFNGGITNTNKLTLGNGGATTGTIQLGNTTTPTNAGLFDVAPTFNLGTGGQIISYLRTTLARTMGNEINPGRALATLTVDDNDATHVLTLAGGNLAVSAGTAPTIALTNGKINLNGNTLTLGLDASTAALAGALTHGTTSWMYNGFFKRWISPTPGNRDFPIGVAAFKRNASINFTGAPTGGGSLTAQWVSTPGGTNGLPLTEPVGAINVSKTINEGYWTITAGDALGGGIYTATFTGSGVAGISDVTQLVLLKRTDAVSPWVLNGTHLVGSGTPTNPVVSRTLMSGFSDFTIGSSDLNVLPSSLLTFSGYKEGSHNTLKWKTATEINNLGFEVQRSTDGVNYSPIGFVNSLAVGGTSTGELNYTYIDNSPAGARQYYRLRQTDINGVAKLSSIVLINGAKPTVLTIGGMFPNPANAELNVLVNAPAADKITMMVTDISGKAVATRTVQVETGSNTISLDVSRLSAGQYMIKLICSSYCESPAAKFIKQ